MSLQQVREKGLAKARGDSLVIPLTDASKGRVILGEVSVLFQFVVPPPEPKREELPATVKGSFFSQIDQFFFLILATSIFVHFSGATFIACQPMPEEKELSLEELPDRFVKAMMPVEVKKPEPKKEEKGKTEEKKVEKTEEKTEVAEKEKPAMSNERKAELQNKVAKTGLLKIIGAAGDGAGAFADVLGSSNGVGDVASALSGAGGVNMATSDALAAGGPKGSGTGSAADIGSLGTNGAGKVNLEEKGPAAIRGKVADAAPEVDSADIDRNKLNAFLRTRIRAIQGCYEKELKRNPSLKGKVVVRFSITTGGRASSIEIDQDTLGNDAVSSCIKTVIRGWVFPFKPESDVEVAYPFVFSPAS
ncbi:MAG: AgmX/PglI C-terminal domain-containing protein [Myxococcaceae bacterium]|nr:AgmX/PglI C-terminal domain-containing protein [Myxococcaceae bacterium]MCA3013838.1 AgmX/PglI C-terminal domain-containing protein [Myxococcaceae bacterium]